VTLPKQFVQPKIGKTPESIPRMRVATVYYLMQEPNGWWMCKCRWQNGAEHWHTYGYSDTRDRALFLCRNSVKMILGHDNFRFLVDR